MIITCIIVEDEPPAAEKLKAFIDKVSFLRLINTFNNPIDAISFINENKVDLIFLDIQMKQLTGIQLLETLPIKPSVIITTAYSEFALKGYELNVVDYLLKPYSFDRFVKSVNKVSELLSKRGQPSPKCIFVKDGYAIEKVLIDDILYIEGQKEFLKVVTTKKKFMTLMSFGELLGMLPLDKFVRVHKSYAVAIDKIESIERHRIKMTDQLIPISETYRKDFYNRISGNIKKPSTG
ncbi:MAG: DNA-binding response regulator [Bacteroidales bacterium]|nr:MAG: DNA-binding response regulator [Bacteroidales bacterium]